MRFNTLLKISTLFLVLLFTSACSTSKTVYYERLSPSLQPHNIKISSLAIGINATIETEENTHNRLNIDAQDIISAVVYELSNTAVMKKVVVIDPTRFINIKKNRIISQDSLQSLAKHLDAESMFIIHQLKLGNKGELAISDLGEELLTIHIEGELMQMKNISNKIQINMDEILLIPELRYMSQSELKQTHDYILFEIGRKIAAKISPNWQQIGRIIYQNKDLKPGNKHFDNKEIEEARKAWSKVYDTSSSEEIKAKAALNMTYTYEVEDNIEEGVKWAEKALTSAIIAEKIQRNQDGLLLIDENKELSFFSYVYIVGLQKRQEELILLSKQLNNDL